MVLRIYSKEWIVRHCSFIFTVHVQILLEIRYTHWLLYIVGSLQVKTCIYLMASHTCKNTYLLARASGISKQNTSGATFYCMYFMISSMPWKIFICWIQKSQQNILPPCCVLAYYSKTSWCIPGELGSPFIAHWKKQNATAIVDNGPSCCFKQIHGRIECELTLHKKVVGYR